jgi:hypothetical protein
LIKELRSIGIEPLTHGDIEEFEDTAVVLTLLEWKPLFSIYEINFIGIPPEECINIINKLLQTKRDFYPNNAIDYITKLEKSTQEIGMNYYDSYSVKIEVANYE